ncbi:MAG: hypothetical protein E6713_09430 [Sporomusaceae bacterium]|nr:hypothetical protein [Sporomusaceae bacterium]
MFSQYFGQYLLNKGILRAEQVEEALDLEQSVRVKLGILAMNAGYMTVTQVEEINALQKKRDRRFGELAIDKGYLTEQQLEQLLKSQEQKYLNLSQVIVDKGFLSLSEVDEALSNYKAENQLSDEHIQALAKADIDAIVRFSLDFRREEKADAYYNYAALTLRNIVRFLNETPVLLKNNPVVGASFPWLVTQNMVSKDSLLTGLGMDDSTLLALAKRFSGEEISSTVDAFAKDCAGEFLNLTNGIFSVNSSNQGISYDLEPQEVMAKKAFPSIKGQVIPVRVSFGLICIFVN